MSLAHHLSSLVHAVSAESEKPLKNKQFYLVSIQLSVD